MLKKLKKVTIEMVKIFNTFIKELCRLCLSKINVYERKTDSELGPRDKRVIDLLTHSTLSLISYRHAQSYLDICFYNSPVGSLGLEQVLPYSVRVHLEVMEMKE